MRPVIAGLAIVWLGVPPAFAQEPAWTADLTLASYVEAWELNDSVEHLTGMMGGVDRTVWRGVALRGEGLIHYVHQSGDATWLRGMTLAMRTRRRARTVQMFLDVGCGLAAAARRVPPSGTRSNYLLLLGGGAEVPVAGAHLTAGVRWLHLSNGGREGRVQNPDIQSLGGFAGLAWKF
jgi:Lipid A 3-O-deacylase (PagL)